MIITCIFCSHSKRFESSTCFSVVLMEEACSSRSLRDQKTMSNNLRILPTHQTTSNHTMSAVNSQSLSTALTVISTNIEGLTASKASILSEMCNRP